MNVLRQYSFIQWSNPSFSQHVRLTLNIFLSWSRWKKMLTQTIQFCGNQINHKNRPPSDINCSIFWRKKRHVIHPENPCRLIDYRSLNLILLVRLPFQTSTVGQFKYLPEMNHLISQKHTMWIQFSIISKVNNFLKKKSQNEKSFCFNDMKLRNVNNQFNILQFFMIENISNLVSDNSIQNV